jgi:Domain of unknown function (DUF4266)
MRPQTTMHMRPRHSATPAALRLGAALLAGMLLAGCQVQPWVKPYEREHLADPIMSFDRNPVSSSYLEHVFEVREGARGASGSVGGGCGCN